jgi:S-adenosylmethionine-diacylglycerol 3-amino-3-carboxypropyl transferase
MEIQDRSFLTSSMGNEDSRLEWTILKTISDCNDKCALAVMGSGSRVMPLLECGFKKIVLVEQSPINTAFTRLRIEGIRNWDRQDYLDFWGYPGAKQIKPDERKKLFEGLVLDHQSKAMLERLLCNNAWESILYTGKWEVSLKKMRLLVGLFFKRTIKDIFGLKNLESQVQYFSEKFPHLRLNIFSWVLGAKSRAKTFFSKRKVPILNVSRSYSEFVATAARNILTRSLIKENSFLQILAFGKITHAEANPIECHSRVFAQIKENLKSCELEWVNGNIMEALELGANRFDFVSFSSEASHFEGTLGRKFLNRIKSKLNPQAIIVLRYFLHRPISTFKQGYINISSQFDPAILSESYQLYRFEILQVESKQDTGSNQDHQSIGLVVRKKEPSVESKKKSGGIL